MGMGQFYYLTKAAQYQHTGSVYNLTHGCRLVTPTLQSLIKLMIEQIMLPHFYHTPILKGSPILGLRLEV